MPVNNTHRVDEHHGIFFRIVKDIAHAHDWLAGPAMTEHNRIVRDIAEARSHINRNVFL